MILAHPRSRSTLMADCFNHYIGEIFNLGIINKSSFELESSVVNYDINYAEAWNEPWAQEYIRIIEKRLSSTPDLVFKVFLEQICTCPQILELIKRLNPTTISIERADKLSAIKSVLLAERRGFSKAMQFETEPFTVSLIEFLNRYRQLVLYPRLWPIYFNVEWSTTYEAFKSDQFPYAQKKPEMQNQHSAESFNLIQNEKQIDEWFHLSKEPHAHNDL